MCVIRVIRVCDASCCIEFIGVLLQARNATPAAASLLLGYRLRACNKLPPRRRPLCWLLPRSPLCCVDRRCRCRCCAGTRLVRQGAVSELRLGQPFPGVILSPSGTR